MHNRIDDCFARLFSERRKGFIPYICAGDPTLKRTVDLAFALETSGADLLELVLPIRLVAPTTPVDRIKAITESAQGFLYYVSREGVTGARDSIARSLPEKVAELRKISDLPVAVGFGISNPEQAREVARHADAV